MFFVENCILGLPYDKELEADLLECFLDDKSLLLFPWVETNLYTFQPDPKCYTFNINDFALERELFRSEEAIGPINCDGERKIIWFSPQGRKELLEVIGFEGITYQCCVLEKEKELSDYTFYLDVYEHFEYQDYEYRGLNFSINMNSEHKRKVLNKIIAIVEGYNYERGITNQKRDEIEKIMFDYEF